METLLNALYLLFGSYFVLYGLHWAVMAAASFFYRPKKRNAAVAALPVAVLFPAYNPNERLIEAVKAALKLQYDGEVTVFVLLQKTNAAIKKELAQLPVVIFEGDYTQVNGNPYHEALRDFSRKVENHYEARNQKVGFALLLDKDNIAAPDFLQTAFSHGSENTSIWQGCRKAIAENGTTAAYDGLSELLNDVLLREGPTAFNAAPELSGSAAIYRWETFTRAIHLLDGSAPGMDKNLMVQLLLNDEQFCYVPSAIVLEEKTEEAAILQKQRIRWFGNQYFNALHYGKKLVMHFSVSSVLYAISLCRPPRSVQALLLPILSLLEIFIGNGYLFSAAFLLTALGVLLFLLKTKRLFSVLKVAVRLPLFAFHNLKSALSGVSKKQQGVFIHTERG